jgi:hypothetical protein
MQARANIFNAELDFMKPLNPSFLTALKGVNGIPTSFNFIKEYGTHFIYKAKFGASFDKTISVS